MVDWVHCNGCTEQPGGNRSFVLTNCGHILCDECKTKEGGNVCLVCKKQCLTVPLSSSMKPEVQMYFTDPADLLTRRLQEVLQVINFQKEHRQRLTARNREKISILAEVRNEFWKLRKYSKELESENKQLRQELAYVKKFLNRSTTPSPNSATSTPGTSQLLLGRLGINTPGSTRTTPGNNEFGYVSSQRSISSQGDVTIAPGRLSVRTPPISGRMGIIPGQQTPLGYSALSRNLNSPAESVRTLVSPTSSQTRSAVPSSHSNSRRTPPSSAASRSSVLPSLLRQPSTYQNSPRSGLTTYSQSIRQTTPGVLSGYSRS